MFPDSDKSPSGKLPDEGLADEYKKDQRKMFPRLNEEKIANAVVQLLKRE